MRGVRAAVGDLPAQRLTTWHMGVAATKHLTLAHSCREESMPVRWNCAGCAARWDSMPEP